MQSLSPTSRYLLALKEGSHQPDDVQQEAVSRLDTIYRELQEKPAAAAPAGGGLRAKFSKLLGIGLESYLVRAIFCRSRKTKRCLVGIYSNDIQPARYHATSRKDCPKDANCRIACHLLPPYR